ncbi:MAG TPA: signal recognition particle-docking protein FtsY [Burkholderiaceae bacterium]|nr:signal recognition particle-docking protein FtsY [Burkholderiaceae bacterium]
MSFLTRWFRGPESAPAPAAPSAESGTPGEAPTADGVAAEPPELASPAAAEPAAAQSAQAQAAPWAEPEPPQLQPAPPQIAQPTAPLISPEPPTVQPQAPDSLEALPAEAAPLSEERKPWLARLRVGLSKTRDNLTGLFVGVKIDEALFEELETALLVSDAGVATTQALLDALREKVRRERLAAPAQVRDALQLLLVELLTPLERPIDIDRAEPLVMMIAGVNGAGKTTSIGKLARHLRREGKTVLLAAGDTFRAAAREQLAEWGSRNQVEVIAQQGGDPAAVAFDAVSAGRSRRTGVVIVDTAGRLPTQTHLMQELGKIHRVIAKAMPGAPHETLLVLDGNTGQNMLAQVQAFDEVAPLTGLVVTKLDGTAKGGALVALAHLRRERPVPVYFIGIGEGIDDLQAFSAREFAAALVG